MSTPLFLSRVIHYRIVKDVIQSIKLSHVWAN
nr:MAG TPA: hypothetical protein [Caudoviricetes sp.]